MSATPSREQLDAFRACLENETGISLDDAKLPLLTEVIRTRFSRTGASSIAAYLERASAPTEIAEIAKQLSVSETYFLRDANQFSALEAILRARDVAGQRHLRVLSAGCASGEEAYSIAITLRETVARPDDWTVSIEGLDLNPASIERAKAASYARWSMRATPDPVRRKYFTESKSGVFEPNATLRSMVRFRQANLRDTRQSLAPSDASLDLVFCRNVLMYLTRPAARAVIQRFARALAPDGYFFVGHAENLRGLSRDFHLLHTHETFYYQRRRAELESLHPSEAPAALPSPGVEPAEWFESIARASERIEALSQHRNKSSTIEVQSRRISSMPEPEISAVPLTFTLAQDLLGRERFSEALDQVSNLPGADEPDIVLLRAMLLLSTGELGDAEAVAQQILLIDDLHAGAHYLIALCRESAGDAAGALEHARAAAYLDDAFAMPHLQLGRLARRQGDAVLARRELELAITLLEREESARILLFGGGFTRQDLLQMARGELGALGAAP